MRHDLAMKPTPSLSIRPAVSTDLPALLECRMGMLADVFPEHSGGGSDWQALVADNRRWLDEHFGRDFQAWIGDLDGRLAGSAAVMWFPHPPGPTNPGGTEAYVLSVYTRPDCRRRGVARALMEAIVREAQGRGIKRIWLRASSEGRPLYEQMGFGPSNYLQLADRDAREEH